ncbi:MAG: YhgE/Pip family protein, partial [Rubrivivax sp.]|nr:YhgE/Pip family protein [Rubrivivax sp.]
DGLTRGAAQFGSSLSALAAALPGDEPLNSFAAGLNDAVAAATSLSAGAQQHSAGSAQLEGGLGQLGQGTARLRAGLALVADKLSSNPALPGGSPAGLSESVQPLIEVAAPVANQGSGFAPNFIPLSLWVGATFCTFLFAYRALPSVLAAEPTLALVLGKLALPALLVCGQALLMLLMLFGVLGVEVHSVPRFVVTLLLTALAFLTLIFALVRIFGDAGKLVALVLLVLQLAAAGATMPIELTTPFFQAIHPYLPMTWVVRSLRIAMFGAFEGAWASSAAAIAAVGVACIALATWFGRWRPVDPEAYRPQIETD